MRSKIKISLALWISAFLFLTLLGTALLLRSSPSDNNTNSEEANSVQQQLENSTPYTWIKRLEKKLLQPTKPDGVVVEIIEMPDAKELWWVQLGAYASHAQANERWQQFSLIYSTSLGDKKPDILREETESGEIYKLRIGSFSDRNAADELCNTLKNEGGECFLTQ